ncbi:MAG: DUF3365 domain-containing protein [Planctomycetota bacterium]
MKSLFTLATLAAPFAAVLAAGAFHASAGAPAAGGGLAQAEQTTVALADALVAAVASISDTVPAGSDPLEIAAASKAVSLLLPPGKKAYRLTDATGDPLDPKNDPKGTFEVQGLQDLVAGAPLVQQVIGGKLRTLVPLTSDMHPNCMTCHTNYAGLPSGTVVGAASLAVKF